MKEKILFVTKGGEECEEGFSYVLELAKTMSAGIEALVMRQAGAEHFQDIMLAAAFAEADDPKTAQDIMAGELRSCREQLEIRIREAIQESNELPVSLVCHSGEGDVSTAIRRVLKERQGIDMVLLSPSLSAKKNSLSLRQLIRNISKPIVTISKPATAEL